MKKLSLFVLSMVLLSSCGGGGGGGSSSDAGSTNNGNNSGSNTGSGGDSSGGSSDGGGTTTAPFSITIDYGPIETQEDVIYSGQFTVEPSQQTTINFTTTQPSQGAIVLGNNGNFQYRPPENWNGNTDFVLTATAPQQNNYSKSETVNVVVSAVNDAPTLTAISSIDYDKSTMILDETLSFLVSYSDVDSSEEQMTFSMTVGNESLPMTSQFIPDTSNVNLSVDTSSLINGGYKQALITISDGTASSSLNFRTWFGVGKTPITIAQDDDPEDGVNEGSSTQVTYDRYFLVGSETSNARTLYLFVADAIQSEIQLSLFKKKLLDSINAIYESDAQPFFTDYFSLAFVVPQNMDGSSSAGIRTDCYDWSPTAYCIGDGDINMSVFDDFLPDNDLVSVLTGTPGRGVALGKTNIQQLREDDESTWGTEFTLVHELGHSHAYAGDEYLEEHGRDVARFADLNINTTTQSDPNQVKWKHWISDMSYVPGLQSKVCAVWASSGGYYDDSDDPYDDNNSADTCTCTYYIWDDLVNKTLPDCFKSVGLFQGTYYSYDENDNYDQYHYRPYDWSIMECCYLEYGKVNAEGFAIASIENQGFLDDTVELVTGADTSVNTGFKITIAAVYDDNKLTLKWYEDGAEVPALENNLVVTFQRPTDGSIKKYTWRVYDNTGIVIAPDDVTNINDFYEGLFNTSFWWNSCSDTAGGTPQQGDWTTNPVYENECSYGYVNGPLGGTWGINWNVY